MCINSKLYKDIYRVTGKANAVKNSRFEICKLTLPKNNSYLIIGSSQTDKGTDDIMSTFVTIDNKDSNMGILGLGESRTINIAGGGSVTIRILSLSNKDAIVSLSAFGYFKDSSYPISQYGELIAIRLQNTVYR